MATEVPDAGRAAGCREEAPLGGCLEIAVPSRQQIRWDLALLLRTDEVIE